MVIVTTFGERLRQLRLAVGLSQAELAGEGLSASYVSLMEAGKRTPSDEVVQQLAARLGCSPSQLVEGKPSEREERIALELAFARLAVEHGESSEARRRLERLLVEGGLSLRVRDELCYQLGIACDRSGDLQGAIRIYLPLFERACQEQTHLLVHVLGISLSGCYQDAGDLHQAIEIGERALKAARAQGLAGTDEYFRLAATVMAAYMDRGDYLHARAWAEGLLEQAQTGGGHSGQAAVYWNLGTLAEREGRVSDALQLYEQALGHMSELESSRDYARLRLSLAIVLLCDDPPQVARAADLLQRCADDLKDLGSRGELAQWNWAMSVVLLHQGDLPAAEMRARQAVDQSSDVPAVQADALQALSDVLVAQGRDVPASTARSEALAVLKEVPLSRPLALNWRALGERLAGDDLEAATEAFRQALDAAGVRDRSRAHRVQVAALRVRPHLPVSTV
jgi:transcriptional regulator with XRE-family HTH domain